MRLDWSKRAIIDLDRQLSYIHEHRPSAAARMAVIVDASVERLIAFPFSGRQVAGQDVRELVVPRTPFIIVYQVRDETIEILRVFHGAQAR